MQMLSVKSVGSAAFLHRQKEVASKLRMEVFIAK